MLENKEWPGIERQVEHTDSDVEEYVESELKVVDYFTCVEFLRDGTLIAGGENGHIVMWKVHGNKTLSEKMRMKIEEGVTGITETETEIFICC